MRFLTACRAFLRVLRDADFARSLAATPALPPAATPAPAAPRRSAALELLAMLQREGRLVDFLQEPIASYSDAQIGAAVREVHAGCHRVLDRAFGLVPATQQAEGTSLRVETGYDAGCVKLTGAVVGAPPFTGTIQHTGWRATRCALPTWTGSDAAAMVVAPTELEVK